MSTKSHITNRSLPKITLSDENKQEETKGDSKIKKMSKYMPKNDHKMNNDQK